MHYINKVRHILFKQAKLYTILKRKVLDYIDKVRIHCINKVSRTYSNKLNHTLYEKVSHILSKLGKSYFI